MDKPVHKVAELMGMLANENRLLILCALLERPMTVGELSKYVPNISAPALSQHLHKLTVAGLISFEKEAQFSRYTISDPHLHKLMALLREEYCPRRKYPSGAFTIQQRHCLRHINQDTNLYWCRFPFLFLNIYLESLKSI